MKSLVVLAVLASAAPAWADARAEAVILFDQGIKEMKAGNFAKACKSFEESNARYPDSGTKGSLARCYEKLGKLASSWLLWRELADTAPTSELRKDAANQAAKLDPRVPKYIVKLVAPTPGLKLLVNGKSAGTAEIPIPIDAGPIAVVASAAGYQDWKGDFTATEGNTTTVTIPLLVVASGGGDDHAKPPPPPPPITDTGKRHKRHLIGGIIGGTGVAAVVVGGVFGLSARSKFADAKRTCGGSIDNCFTDQVDKAQGLVDDARSAANLSSIAFAAGGALVVTGAVVWLTAPSAEKRVAIESPGSAGARSDAKRRGVLIVPTGNGFAVSGRF